MIITSQCKIPQKFELMHSSKAFPEKKSSKVFLACRYSSIEGFSPLGAYFFTIWSWNNFKALHISVTDRPYFGLGIYFLLFSGFWFSSLYKPFHRNVYPSVIHCIQLCSDWKQLGLPFKSTLRASKFIDLHLLVNIASGCSISSKTSTLLIIVYQ